MKKRIRLICKTCSYTLATVAVLACFTACDQKSTKSKYSAATETPTQAPTCFLVGEMKSTQAPQSKGFAGSLGSAVRLKFGAESLEGCKQVGISYCTGNVSRGFVPLKLTLIYTTYAPERSSAYYSIKPNCTIELGSAP